MSLNTQQITSALDYQDTQIEILSSRISQLEVGVNKLLTALKILELELKEIRMEDE